VNQVNRVTLKLFRVLRWTPQRGHPFLWTNIQSQGVHISGGRPVQAYVDAWSSLLDLSLGVRESEDLIGTVIKESFDE
ncbi:hypothetical protein C1I93_28930, partial [Micromonospora endophytica]